MTRTTDTDLITAGRNPSASFGMVNPPVCRASTILYPDLAAFEEGKSHQPGKLSYGRYGTPTTHALEAAVTKLHGGDRTLLFPSGLAAISGTLSALLAPGDHILLSDSVYGPVRRFAASHLARLGIQSEFFDPLARSLAPLLRPNTRCVYLEAPGSLTFEMHDVEALVHSVRSKAPEAWVVFDNTWSTPLFYRPLEHGADIVIEAATKYLGGHSDVMMGTATVNERASPIIEPVYRQFGWCVGADDAYAILRGLRTLAPRMRAHENNALRIARWLQARPEVSLVMHPALPEDPGHALWSSHWNGASGLFGCVMRPVPETAWQSFFEGLNHFGLGGSWGGYESLLFPDDPGKHRSAGGWNHEGRYLRVHAGLEDAEDLLDDLEHAFKRMSLAASIGES